jgi:glycine/D-amino acid oxidase-like deaminating enzyme
MKRAHTTWQEAVKDRAPLPALNADISCDVCIIGSGITGVTAAYYLARAGKRVVLLEKRTMSSSVTAYTTAFITSIIDTNLTDVERMIGRAGVRNVVQSGEDAIDIIERIIKTEKIDCEFTRVPHYSIAYTDRGMEAFKEDEKLLLSLGYASSIHPASDLPFENKGAVEMPRQAKFHPLKYLAALRDRAIELGAECYEQTEAGAIEGGEEGNECIVTTTKGYDVSAGSVIIATYNPFVQPWWYRFKKGTYTSYIIECEIPSGVLPEFIAEDDSNPYNFFRVDKVAGHDRLIVGGEDHRSQVPLSKRRAHENLERYVKKILGETPFMVVKRWSGPILEQTDGLPLIGRYSREFPNRYVATAFSGNGMTYGTTAGILLGDLIMGKDNHYETVYRPNRPISSTEFLIKGRDYLGEFVEGIARNLFSHKEK